MNLDDSQLLQSTKITLSDDNLEYELDIVLVDAIQLNFSNESMVITGQIILEDDSLSQFFEFPKQTIEIEMLDAQDNLFKRSFKILTVNHLRYGIEHRQLEITIQDEASYQLMNSFLGKSYSSGNMKDVINDFLRELNVDMEIQGDLEFKEPLIIPKHINNLDFFEAELYRMGQSIAQMRDGYKIFKTEDLAFEKLEIQDPFIQNEKNQYYVNNIHEFQLKDLIREYQVPKFKTFEFDYLRKEFNSTDNNVITMYGTEKDNILDTIGFEPINERLSKHNERLRRETLKHYGQEIAVNGSLDREVNEIQDILLTGNKMNQESIDNIDTVYSGEYVICAIQDAWTENRLIQKLYLRRQGTGEQLKNE